MRSAVVFAGAACFAWAAFHPIAHAGSGAKGIYLKHAEAAMAAGRFGDAMAAYDAAHDEAPADESEEVEAEGSEL